MLLFFTTCSTTNATQQTYQEGQKHFCVEHQGAGSQRRKKKFLSPLPKPAATQHCLRGNAKIVDSLSFLAASKDVTRNPAHH
jgi:hypothetical protein